MESSIHYLIKETHVHQLTAVEIHTILLVDMVAAPLCER